MALCSSLARTRLCRQSKIEGATQSRATVAEAFAEIERLAKQVARTGAPSDAIELVVLDSEGSDATSSQSLARSSPFAGDVRTPRCPKCQVPEI